MCARTHFPNGYFGAIGRIVQRLNVENILLFKKLLTKNSILHSPEMRAFLK